MNVKSSAVSIKQTTELLIFIHQGFGAGIQHSSSLSPIAHQTCYAHPTWIGAIICFYRSIGCSIHFYLIQNVFFKFRSNFGRVRSLLEVRFYPIRPIIEPATKFNQMLANLSYLAKMGQKNGIIPFI